ncbi:hypothetical protein PT974_04295 [Cladobotryum mycophilum]|uniref:G-protein coupled receptor n=1 Tax=Cladobotryum mycophilum TaxID=491253 RepID=A0ABR0SUN9_9HYPO
MPEALSMRQLHAISDIERACSVLSLVGSVFTIVTFCFSRSFHKPINRLVFYASFGNMMSNVGTLISRHYLKAPDSVGCQFQAFLIQMFMPADAFWTLAMAFNVYLTFYHKYDARMLRKMEVPYLIGCYGIPFVPAFIYIFVKNREGKRAYGNATLWCWITTEWDIWRILTFYGPVWVVILIAFFIYIRAGRTIYEKRKQLDKFSSSDPDPLSVNWDVISTIKTTEVTITTESALEAGAFHMNAMDKRSSIEPNYGGPNPLYSVQITAASRASSEFILPIQGATLPQKTPNVVTIAAAPQRSTMMTANPRRRHQDLNNAAWAYTKCSILFFTAILITWIPSSANRVYSVVHNGEINAPLEFMSAFVLPLQGFWNAVIYIVTSWNACKNLVSDLRQGRRPAVTELVGGMGGQDDAMSVRHSRRISQFRPGSISMKRSDDTESTTELANSRAASADGQSNDFHTKC